MLWYEVVGVCMALSACIALLYDSIWSSMRLGWYILEEAAANDHLWCWFFRAAVL